MRARCTFEEMTRTPDGGGGFSAQWQERFTRSGALTMGGFRADDEALLQGAAASVVRAVATVREDEQTRSIKADWRVRIEEGGFAADAWNIRAVHRPAPGWLRLSVEKGAAA